ncbi:MAG: nucleotide exchange factor GrpE [Candidatus Paceibacterota bacterium]
MKEDKNIKYNIEELKNKLEECENEKNEYLNGWKRAKADFINYKKEESDRFDSMIRNSQKKLISDILTVLDSFELGIVMTEGDKMEKKGVELIKGQLEDSLKKNGVIKIKVQIGDDFNPEIHEAVEQVESDQPEGTVAGVVEKGYAINDKVIRPVKVKISVDKNN